jgi:hypothetical protein
VCSHAVLHDPGRKQTQHHPVRRWPVLGVRGRTEVPNVVNQANSGETGAVVEPLLLVVGKSQSSLHRIDRVTRPLAAAANVLFARVEPRNAN